MRSSVLNMNVDFLFAKLDKDGEYLRSVAILPVLSLFMFGLLTALTSVDGYSTEERSIRSNFFGMMVLGLNALFLGMPHKLWRGASLRGRAGLLALAALGGGAHVYWFLQLADLLVRSWFGQQRVFAAGDITRFGNGINDETVYDLTALALAIGFILLCSVVSLVVLTRRPSPSIGGGQ